jgi:hypothetical protein
MTNDYTMSPEDVKLAERLATECTEAIAKVENSTPQQQESIMRSVAERLRLDADAIEDSGSQETPS